MLDMLEKLEIDCEYNIAKHKFVTAYGEFRIFSGNNPERMVGSNLTWCGADELDILPTKRAMMVYRKAISRLRGCEKAPFFTVTTLEGYRAVYDLFYSQTSEEKHLIKASSYDNPYLPDGYIDSMKNDYDHLMQEMYINGNPVNLNGSAAYYTFDRNIHVKPCKDMDAVSPDGKRYLPLWVGMDFNIEPLTASVSVLVNNVLYTIAEYHLRVGHTRMMCELIANDYPDRVITFCPDMTSDKRNTIVSYSDIDIIKSFGFQVVGVRNRSQRDRLILVNNTYEKGKAFIDPSCKHLIHERERVIITDNQIDKTDKALTHMSDGNDNTIAWLFTPRPQSFIR